MCAIGYKKLTIIANMVIHLALTENYSQMKTENVEFHPTLN